MQKSIFQKVMPGIIPIILLATGVWFLFKMGMEPLWAAIAVIILKGFIRFVYRLTVMLVAVAVVISLLTFLICI
jgi:mannose/fructose/N-acetylgalactosamine-specific phosphotransferase system component IID